MFHYYTQTLTVKFDCCIIWSDGGHIIICTWINSSWAYFCCIVCLCICPSICKLKLWPVTFDLRKVHGSCLVCLLLYSSTFGGHLLLPCDLDSDLSFLAVGKMCHKHILEYFWWYIRDMLNNTFDDILGNDFVEANCNYPPYVLELITKNILNENHRSCQSDVAIISVWKARSQTFLSTGFWR